MISEQDVKDAITSVMWNASQTHKRLALDEAMTGRFGTSTESYVMSGKIEACKEIAKQLGIGLPDLYYLL